MEYCSSANSTPFSECPVCEFIFFHIFSYFHFNLKKLITRLNVSFIVLNIKEKIMIKTLSTQWLMAKSKEQAANAERLNIEISLYKEIAKSNEINKDGSTKIDADGIKVTITSGLTTSVDQEKAALNPELFSVKYGYSKTILKNLSDEQVSVLQDAVTMKPSKPTFKVEVL
jgi:hypothetical protein